MCSGNPGTTALPGWPQYRSDQPYTVDIGPDVRSTTADRQEEFALWR
ncbi:MAG: hypothetical protein OXH13_02950 [Chloroflexi bacterium]|nr:hypothetical protein [Chloroflexota bacterium]MCY3696980.1 hypothetical protein [Chloroflexota bacterium]MXX30995.1 carboxylesterase family protein [Chloroflexota bacterium]MXX80384.1 carboxylesterase family protein [Chloroflexota bacterium]MYB23123.1 carboxylesterase family protein [Chloroflexota bacterium]